ncbi:LacI family DNA-binding transcriptional regulator [Pseudochelatococcus sp. B33]
MNEKPRIAEIATLAGVSTATVDRVLNERGGVRSRTIRKVQEAIQLWESGGGLHARPQRHRFGVFDLILPAMAGASTDFLAKEMQGFADKMRVQLRREFVERMNPFALAEVLRERATRGSDGVAFQALDHQVVREAVSLLAARNIPVVTLCSDIGGVERLAYVGMDNRAAGRTAGYLMGRLSRRPGKVAVIWGGQLYRCHEEREFGFRSILRAEFPELEVLDLITGNDDTARNYREVLKVAEANPNFVGAYCVGAGMEGVVQALSEAGRTGQCVTIGHNLCPLTKTYLMDGRADVIIHQNMTQIARVGLRCLHDGAMSAAGGGIPIEVITRENMTHR